MSLQDLEEDAQQAQAHVQLLGILVQRLQRHQQHVLRRAPVAARAAAIRRPPRLRATQTVHITHACTVYICMLIPSLLQLTLICRIHLRCLRLAGGL
jgi:hypothetical protein